MMISALDNLVKGASGQAVQKEPDARLSREHGPGAGRTVPLTDRERGRRMTEMFQPPFAARTSQRPVDRQ